MMKGYFDTVGKYVGRMAEIDPNSSGARKILSNVMWDRGNYRKASNLKSRERELRRKRQVQPSSS